MALLRTEAVVIGWRALDEADKLVFFYTRQYGRLTAVGKGARRLRSRFGAALEPFTHGQLIVFQKKADALCRIQQMDIVHSFQALREDLRTISAAARILSRTASMVPEREPNAAIFDGLLRALDQLYRLDPLLVTCLYEARLLSDAGYQPQMALDRCAGCRTPMARGSTYFTPDAGGVRCSRCHHGAGRFGIPVSRGAAAVIRQATRMPWNQLFRLRAAPAVLAEVRQVLEVYFDHLLERRRFVSHRVVDAARWEGRPRPAASARKMPPPGD